MISKLFFGFLGVIAWFLGLVGIWVFLLSLSNATSNPGGFLGSTTFSILWCFGAYWVGKNMFKAGEYKFIKTTK